MGDVIQLGDYGYGVPGSPRWNFLWIMELEDDELRDFVLEIGVEKTIEAMDYGNRFRRN